MMVIRILLCGILLTTVAVAQPDTTQKSRQLGVKFHQGLFVPDQVTPATGKAPLGAELTYSWSRFDRQAWQQCRCFTRAGLYATYYTFQNPATLGQTAGAGLFFEPLIAPRRRLYFSVRFTAGLTYLTRLYDPVTNPTNRSFSFPVSAMTGVGINAYYKLTNRIHLSASALYNHISNAGIRQPNQGLNVPGVALGVVYVPHPIVYPGTRYWRSTRLNQRWMARALLMGSVRVLARTAYSAEKTLPMMGLNLTGGYRLGQSHVLSGGFEVVDDWYFKEQIRQWNYEDQHYRQGSLLGGYEFWQGRYSFTAHMAWEVLGPRRYKPDTYQKYGLLYRFDSGFTLGFNVKAYLDTTKGFQAVGGMVF